jgi:hypothetical protein
MAGSQDLLSRYSDGIQAGRPGFVYRQWQEIFLYSTASRPALGPTQPPIYSVPKAFSPGLKLSGAEADHSPPSSAEAKNEAIYPLHHTSSRRIA